ncbi:MAG: aldehyde dehydrogenase family protein [Actinomycetota bacterium]
MRPQGATMQHSPLTMTPIEEIGPLVDATRAAFETGRTRPLEWRTATLERLRELVESRADALGDALEADLGKCAMETTLSETGVVLSEIDHALAHLPDWVRPVKRPTPAAAQPGSSRIEPQPLGVACVIAPWNYPVNLSLGPVIAAVAAGNAVVLKPSELAPASAAALGELVDALDDPALAIVQGGVAETTELLEQRFDHILYTGGGRVGRVVMRAAAEHLTPVTLELGGKSPAVVTSTAKIDQAAKRLAWGKWVNAGQTCIAPDYVLVADDVHDQLVDRLVATIAEFYGDDPKQSPDYARIVTDSHFHRLEKLLDSGTVAAGGDSDVDDRYIAPTVLVDVEPDAPVMEEEIFGPVLPILRMESLDDAVARINDRDKPLALYVFSEEDAEVDHVLSQTSSGGVTVNGTLFHFANAELPFGGVGESGMGAYHGKFGFDTFSHQRAVYERSTRVDLPMMYPPYTDAKRKMLDRALRLGDPREVVAKVKQVALRRR